MELRQLIKDLTKQIKNIFNTTLMIDRSKPDFEKLSDLYYSVSKSYTKSPSAKIYWLEKLAQLNEKNKCYTEVCLV
jgi:hypothetical protein